MEGLGIICISDNAEQLLNKLGDEGWDLVLVGVSAEPRAYYNADKYVHNPKAFEVKNEKGEAAVNYLWHILVMINLYAILALSFNLVAGYTGLISFCHAAFYGIGAYTTALLMMNAGWGFLPALLAAILLTMALSLVIGVPSLRLRGDYFVLVTLGFQIIVFTILYNWVNLTRGPYGIPGIPTPKFFGIGVDSVFGYFLFSSFLALLCGIMLWALKESPFGRALKAVREDEIAAAALGKNVPLLKTAAFSIAAAFAAVPGAMFACYMRYVDPTSFTLMESVFIATMVIIGGAGNLEGPLVGAALMVFLPEFLRFLQIPDAVAANVRQVIYGLLLIILVRYRPQGLMGEYKFGD